MNNFVAWLKKNISNPIVVSVWTLFAGAFGEQFWGAYQSGHFDWSLKSIQSMVVAALCTTGVALAHLYLPQPNPTVTAVIPPSKTPVQVPAELTPVDSKAVKTKDQA